MQQSNERTRGESVKLYLSHTHTHSPGIVHWHHLPARGHSSHQTFALVMPSDYIFPKQTELRMKSLIISQRYRSPSDKSVIDHMLGLLHTIQHAGPVTLNAKMSHSPQMWVTLPPQMVLSWRTHSPILQIIELSLNMYLIHCKFRVLFIKIKRHTMI